MPKIIPELKDLLDTLRDESAKELEQSLLRDGQRDPIVIWKEHDAILDGHNRFAILERNKITPKFVEMSLPDLAAARKWIIENQIARRNLTADRFDYFIGILYNEKKADNPDVKGPDGHTEAERIAEKYGVSERTVRRAGQSAKGVDRLAEIKGKIAKQKQLDGKGELTKPELTELGKIEKPGVAKKMLEKLAEIKAQKAEVKAAVKAPEKAAKLYPVAFCAPAFDMLGFSVTTLPRLPLEKDALVYMQVPDAHLPVAMDLIVKWGLHYEASFVFHGQQNMADGVYSKVKHDFMLVASRGTPIGPKKGKEADSVVKFTGKIDEQMIKLVGGYHSGEKLDARKGVTAMGWFPLEV